MMSAAPLAAARLDLIHREARADETVGELPIRRRRPYGQQTFRPKRIARGFQPLQVVKPIVRVAAEAVGAVIHIKQDRIEA